MKNKVLLLDGGGTQTLPVAKSLYRGGYSVHIFYEHKLSYGYGTRYARRKIQSPNIKDEDKYLVFLRNYLHGNSIDVVIPMSDPSAMLLSKNRQSLLKLCRFVAPDYDVFMKGYDKNQLMSVCRENGFPHPKTIDMQLTEVSAVEEMFFPAILKPNLTAGGRGMKILSNKKEFELIFAKNVLEYGPCHLQELIPSGGRQFKAQLFLDERHQLINSSVIHKQRFYPVAGGSSCFNMTVRNDAIIDLCNDILQKIGWIGFADFDLIEDPRDGVIKIMEINPRIPACIKSAIESGIDYAGIIVDSSMGREVGRYSYVPGRQLRHIGFDVLWFLHCDKRFKTSPKWFNFFNKRQSFQDISLDDPSPFLFGTLGNIRKISNSDFRNSKKSKVKS